MLDRLLARPWALVGAVALVVALPLALLGEIGARDTLERARADQVKLTAATAERAADIAIARVVAARDQLLTILTTAPGNQLLGTSPGVAQLLAQDRPLVGSYVTQLMFIGGGTGPGTQGPLIADPVGRGAAAKAFVQQRHAGILETYAAPNANRPGRPLFAYSGIYDLEEGPGRLAVSLAVSEFTPGPFVGNLTGLRTFAAELEITDVGRSFTPLLATVTDVYLIRSDGRLIARAAGGDLPERIAIPVPAPGSAGEADDPLVGGRRLVAVMRLAELGSSTTGGGNATDVVVVRQADVAQREIGPALDQARAFRLAFIGLLLLGTYLFAQVLRANTRLLAQLRETNAALAQATAAKSKFLASMSHELRTPMNAILGFTDVLLAGVYGALNERQKESLGHVRSGGRDLLALVNDVLDLSKIEADRIDLSPERFAPLDLTELVLEQLRPLAQADGTQLFWRDGHAPTEMEADRGRARQILTNLVGNALKFAKGGEVSVTVSAADGLVRFAVRDTGRGVPAEQRDAIFEEFRQIRADDPGTGLGLPISRRLARLMGGDLTVESEEGRGSTFTLSLPIEAKVAAARG